MILNSVLWKRTLRVRLRVTSSWLVHCCRNVATTRFGQIDDSTRSILIDHFHHQHHNQVQVRRFVAAFPVELTIVVAIPRTPHGTKPHIHALLLTWQQIFSVTSWWDMLHVHVLRPPDSQKLAAWLRLEYVKVLWCGLVIWQKDSCDLVVLRPQHQLAFALHLIGKFGTTPPSLWDRRLSFLITDGIS